MTRLIDALVLIAEAAQRIASLDSLDVHARIENISWRTDQLFVIQSRVTGRKALVLHHGITSTTWWFAP